MMCGMFGGVAGMMGGAGMAALGCLMAATAPHKRGPRKLMDMHPDEIMEDAEYDEYTD
jgi:hypothetical protein